MSLPGICANGFRAYSGSQDYFRLKAKVLPFCGTTIWRSDWGVFAYGIYVWGVLSDLCSFISQDKKGLIGTCAFNSDDSSSKSQLVDWWIFGKLICSNRYFSNF